MCFEEKTPREFFLLNWTERKNEMFEHKWHGVIAFQMSVDKLRDPTKIIFKLKRKRATDERRDSIWIIQMSFYTLFRSFPTIIIIIHSNEILLTNFSLSLLFGVFFTPSQSLIIHSFDCWFTQFFFWECMCSYSFEEEEKKLWKSRVYLYYDNRLDEYQLHAHSCQMFYN